MTKKRRPVQEEQALIRERMAEAGIRKHGAYMRKKMALNGYVSITLTSPVRAGVAPAAVLKQSNQVAIQANTYGGIYPEEIAACRDHASLWGPLPLIY